MGGTRLVTRPTSQVQTPEATIATGPRTLNDFIDSRSGGFDVLRLILAFLVLVSHTWVLGGFGREPGPKALVSPPPRN